MKAAFVCRGSVTDGLGHVMRTVTVANEMAREDEVSVVVIGDDTARAIASRFAENPIMAVDAEAACREVSDDVQLIVFDMLDIDEASFGRLSDGRPTASISPVFSRQRSVDRSYGRAATEPDRWLAERPESHRRGPTWAVIGSHVTPVTSPDYVAAAYAKPLGVGIAMGGTDAPNLTLRTIEKLCAVDRPLMIWALLGEGYAHSFDRLVETVRRFPEHEILLAKATRSMWTVLGRTGLTVLAGGITSYEAAYAGIPAVNVLVQPEHRHLITDLEHAGAALSLDVDGNGFDTLHEAVGALEADRDRLFTMHRRSQDLIDGRGAERIVADLRVLVADR